MANYLNSNYAHSIDEPNYNYNYSPKKLTRTYNSTSASNLATPGSGGFNHHRRQSSVIDLATEYMGDKNVRKAKKWYEAFEDKLDRTARPIRPWLPAVGRFLIVVTFIEDALRILAQMNDQNYYLQKHRHFPWGLSHLFLWTNVLTMSISSGLIIAKKYREYACLGLFTVVIAQGFGYGLIFDINFFLRNLSVIGGLLMVLSDTLRSKKSLFADIPSDDLRQAERQSYFQLFGRVLLIFLFLGFIFNGQFTFSRALVSLLGLVACINVALGLRAKFSALFLVVLLTFFNLLVNSWWTLPASHPQRDFLKYDFFQTLSIIGGLLLLVNIGPGNLSIDQKKQL